MREDLLGPRLKSMVLIGAVLGSGLDLYRTQVVDGAFDLLLRVADTDRDGVIPRNEYTLDQLRLPPKSYDSFSPAFFKVIQDLEQLGHEPTLDFFDRDQDGYVTRSEVQHRVFHELYLRVVSAVNEGSREKLAALPDNDYSYNYNTLEQFQEWFAEPSKASLLAVSSFPVSILFGENDFNTSPRQLDWFLPMVWSKGNSEISWRTIAGEGHYGPKLAEETLAIFRRRSLGFFKLSVSPVDH